MRIIGVVLAALLLGYGVLVGVSWAGLPARPGDACATVPRDMASRYTSQTGLANYGARNTWDQECHGIGISDNHYSQLTVLFHRCHALPLYPRVQADCARRRFADDKRGEAADGGKVYDLPGLGDTAYVWLPDNAEADLAGPLLGTGVHLGVLRGADVVWISYNPVPSTPTTALGAEIELAKVILAGVR